MILIHACMQISKYHAIVLHFTCMGTSRISGVSARHGFEQAIFFSQKVVHHNYRSLSNKIYQRVAHSFIGVCPMKNIGGGPTFYRSLFNELSRELKHKFFVLKIVFIHGKMHL